MDVLILEVLQLLHHHPVRLFGRGFLSARYPCIGATVWSQRGAVSYERGTCSFFTTTPCACSAAMRSRSGLALHDNKFDLETQAYID